MRAKLIAWQWSDYAAKHQHRANLVLHIFAVPMFWAGTLALVLATWFGSLTLGIGAVAAMLVSLVMQGRGHKLEPETPTPFEGALDFPSRFLTEQFVTFPRYLLSGGWYRALKKP